MNRGRPKAELSLSPVERKQLELAMVSAAGGPRTARRAEMILLSADGFSNGEVAERTRTTSATVGKWRGRFGSERMAGLSNRKLFTKSLSKPLVSVAFRR